MTLGGWITMIGSLTLVWGTALWSYARVLGRRAERRVDPDD